MKSKIMILFTLFIFLMTNTVSAVYVTSGVSNIQSANITYTTHGINGTQSTDTINSISSITTPTPTGLSTSSKNSIITIINSSTINEADTKKLSANQIPQSSSILSPMFAIVFLIIIISSFPLYFLLSKIRKKTKRYKVLKIR